MLYIYSLIGKPKVYVHISGDGNRILETLRCELGKIKFEAYVDPQGQWWITFGKAHLERAVQILPEFFGEVRLIKEYNNRQKCTTSCQRAHRDLCECSCLGASHKGAHGLWTNPVGTELLFQDERSIVYYTFRPKLDRTT